MLHGTFDPGSAGIFLSRRMVVAGRRVGYNAAEKRLAKEAPHDSALPVSPGLWPTQCQPFLHEAGNLAAHDGLPYQALLGDPRKAPKGKLPYIEDDGVLLGDSHLILDYLRAQYGVDPDAGLTPPQRALSTAVTRMLEEHFYWVMLHSRWIDPQGWPVSREVFFGSLPRPLRDLVPLLVRRSLRRDLRGQGLGRHDLPEIQSLARRMWRRWRSCWAHDPTSSVNNPAPWTRWRMPFWLECWLSSRRAGQRGDCGAWQSDSFR